MSKKYGFTIKIPCDQCHRAERGMNCIFCSGTKLAGIMRFFIYGEDPEKEYQKNVLALKEKNILMVETHWHTEDGLEIIKHYDESESS